MDDAEKERFSRLDKAKIPEKRVKQIVTRVLGADVHINKTMLRIIGGIAKVWVGEIVEEAKLLQVKEEYEIRESLGLNKYPTKVEEDITLGPENPESEPKVKETPQEPSSQEMQGEEDVKEADNKEDEEDMASDEEKLDPRIIEMQTLHNDRPLQPYHLRLARENYEKKRLKAKMVLF